MADVSSRDRAGELAVTNRVYVAPVIAERETPPGGCEGCSWAEPRVFRTANGCVYESSMALVERYHAWARGSSGRWRRQRA